MYFFLLLEHEAEQPQFSNVSESKENPESKEDPESKEESVSIVQGKNLHRDGFNIF